MTNDDVVNLLLALPQAREIGDETYWRRTAPAIIQSVVDDIMNRYDWDFTITEYSDVTTTSGTAEYTLSGADNDLRDIISIRLERDVLQKLRAVDAYDLLEGDATPLGEVEAWYQSGVDSFGAPKVTLIDTPSTSGDTLYVLYRKKGEGIATLPERFGSLVTTGVLSWISPQYIPLYERQMKLAIRRHKVGGKDINVAQIDPVKVNMNNKIFDLYRTG